jgi:hypothetical protein
MMKAKRKRDEAQEQSKFDQFEWSRAMRGPRLHFSWVDDPPPIGGGLVVAARWTADMSLPDFRGAPRVTIDPANLPADFDPRDLLWWSLRDIEEKEEQRVALEKKGYHLPW